MQSLKNIFNGAWLLMFEYLEAFRLFYERKFPSQIASMLDWIVSRWARYERSFFHFVLFFLSRDEIKTNTVRNYQRFLVLKLIKIKKSHFFFLPDITVPSSIDHVIDPPLTSHFKLKSAPSTAVWFVDVSVNLSGAEMTVRHWTIRLEGIYNRGLNTILMGAC